MDNKIKEITEYLRSAVAAQVNKKIEFKEDKYYYFSLEELINGKIINKDNYHELFLDSKNKKELETINVIIVAKTIKTVFESEVKKTSEVEDLTGVYYIPATLYKNGTLYYNNDNKMPWIPREYLQPMVEPVLSIGHFDDFDKFMSESIGRIHKIKSWQDYIFFAIDLYETVTKSKFKEPYLKDIELEKNVYILKDITINSTAALIKLYDNLIKDFDKSSLYKNLLNLDSNKIEPLIINDKQQMSKHCGQMGGEYSLSPSQRECINHFNNIKDGEILAVNGPPGTGKTTLLQSIVANLYVERALKKEKPPLIVASSTNNQAVTNIIESFGKIKIVGYGNLEERWIEGVESFAVYFPSGGKKGDANSKGFHFTNCKGENFVSDIDNEENLEKSKDKLLHNFNKYFDIRLRSIEECEVKLHDELVTIERIRVNLLSIFNELESYNLDGNSIDKKLDSLKNKVNKLEDKKAYYFNRIEEWKKHFKKIPFIYKLLKFISLFNRKINTKNRLFINENEDFLNESMSFDEIEEKYSSIIKKVNYKLKDLKNTLIYIENLKSQYDENITMLKNHKIDLFKNNKTDDISSTNKVNEIMDMTLRYIEFWLSVHYYECRWAKGEDKVTGNQKGKTFKNVIEKLYSRLSMITPCYVMTFYQLPKNLLAYDGSSNFFLYNYIDLLIVDEAGQVSPEIAACCFSLAKKSVVVGDINQIEPVWSVSEALDKSLALNYKVIESIDEFEKLKDLGINTSSSSIMRVASKCCKYKKHDDRGLFLSEHRRCYNEIISYCNQLVYKGNLEPMRGRGSEDEKNNLKQLPPMGFRQVDSEFSIKKGNSRLNKNEASEIANWINNNFNLIREAYPKENVKELIGIITPFKAQVGCLERELKNTLSNETKSYISVGTVHTFQGAERKIIIMSTVYGENEGCYFIDANRSMLNVAVSRAKDSFLVFGDINCFSNDKKNPSGLLKQYIKDNKI